MADPTETSAEVIFQSENYLITAYSGDGRSALIVMISAGGSTLGGDRRVEEFKKSLISYTGTVIFVNDLKRYWFNHRDTETAFNTVRRFIGDIAQVGALGESMGGSGAILITNFVPSVSRVLAFTPQFSVVSPFCLFDETIKEVGSERLEEYYFSNYCQTPIKEKCVLVYSDSAWQDLLHQTLFEVAGFNVINVQGGSHAVASHLKHHGRLEPIIKLFSAFDETFSPSKVREALGHFVAERKLSPQFLELLPLEATKFPRTMGSFV